MEDIYQENKEIFGRIGLIATQFSTLDFFVTQTISVLISPKVPMTDAILTENMPFSKKLECLKKTAEVVLHIHKKENEQLFKMIKDAKEYSKYRNIFLHGLACIVKEDLEKGFIIYKVAKFHRDKDMEKEPVILHYERLKEEKFEISELKKISHSLGRLCDDWMQFIKHAKEIIKNQSTNRNKKKKGVNKADIEGVNQLELDLTLSVQKI